MSPRLPRVTAAELIHALRKDGWLELRRSGSHVVLSHPIKPGIVVVAIHPGKVVAIGTLSAILDQAGLSPDELRGLLLEVAMRQYTVVLEWDPEAAAYSVVVPALPGCTSQGDTVAEALAHGREAIELYLEVLRERGEPIPDDVPTQAIRIEVAA